MGDGDAAAAAAARSDENILDALLDKLRWGLSDNSDDTCGVEQLLVSPEDLPSAEASGTGELNVAALEEEAETEVAASIAPRSCPSIEFV